MKLIKYIITGSVLATAMFFIASCAAPATTTPAEETAMVRVQVTTDTDKLDNLTYAKLTLGDKALSAIGTTAHTAAFANKAAIGAVNKAATYVEVPVGEVTKLTLEARIADGDAAESVNFKFGPDVAVTGATAQDEVTLTGKVLADDATTDTDADDGYKVPTTKYPAIAAANVLLKHDGKLTFVKGKKYTITLDPDGSTADTDGINAANDKLLVDLKVTEDDA